MNNERFIILDNFYSNPEAVRELARKTEYFSQGVASINFAGNESINHFYSPSLIEKLEEAVGAHLTVDTVRNAFGRFRYAFGSAKRRTRVHSDDTDWTAVVYLTHDEDCRGGTQFFRHRETGLDGPPDVEALARLGMTRQEFDNEIIMRDTLESSRWDVVDQCDMKFNRCVLLRGRRYFHGSDQLFGETFDNARLTQNFFFDVG